MPLSNSGGKPTPADGTTAVVIAAGKGSRLSDSSIVKPLATVGGHALIEHVLLGLADAGVQKVIVVTGYGAGSVEESLGKMTVGLPLSVVTIKNPDFTLSNGVSVLAARPLVAGPFILAMADHLFDPDIVRRLRTKGTEKGELVLAIDRRLNNPDVDIDDVTRVATRQGGILKIGKNLDEFDAFDTGLFYATPDLFDALDEIRSAKGDASLSEAVQLLADRGSAAVMEIGERFWIDIDEPKMLDRAERHLISMSRR